MKPLLRPFLASTALATLACGAPLAGDWAGDCDVGIAVYALSYTGVAADDAASTKDTTGDWRVYTGAGSATAPEGASDGTLTVIECLSEACTNAEDPYTAGQFMFDMTTSTSLRVMLKGALDDASGLASGACYVTGTDGLVYTGVFELEPAGG